MGFRCCGLDLASNRHLLTGYGLSRSILVLLTE
jgi:hypothetical protein